MRAAMTLPFHMYSNANGNLELLSSYFANKGNVPLHYDGTADMLNEETANIFKFRKYAK